MGPACCVLAAGPLTDIVRDMQTYFRFWAAVILLVFCMVGLPHRADAEDPLVVFAASSLTDVMAELSREFEEQYGQRIIVSVAATSVLARQIKNGAPAHVFVSADTAWMDDVINAGAIIPESWTIIAGNQLVLAGARDISFPPVSGMALAAGYPLSAVAPGLSFAIANPDHVPAGIYARQALQSLGLWDALKDRLVPMPDVRAVIANIDRGEVAGGFVYATDLEFAPNARIIGRFPDSSHTPIHYVAGILTGPHPAMADRFLAFLRSPEAEDVFVSFGFLPPPPSMAISTEAGQP